MAKKNRRKKNKKKVDKHLVILIGILAIILIGVVVLFYACGAPERSIEKRLAITPDDGLGYDVRGLDVSEYQGDVNFDILHDQGYSFVFIKATEGPGHKDSRFTENWEKVQSSHMFAGAYHFMHFSTPGYLQAANFLSSVEPYKGMLPPVIDIELHGDYTVYPPEKEQFDRVLKPLLACLETAYGQKPIIYCTKGVYANYIDGNYDNPIWISDPDFGDTLPGGAQWTFLQYAFSAQLEGYTGGTSAIDQNVFWGTTEDFVQFVLDNQYR